MVKIKTESKVLMGDLHTPMGTYLKLRDIFRDTILLESTEHNADNGSYSFIGVNAIAGIEINNYESYEIKFPNLPPQKLNFQEGVLLTDVLQDFAENFKCEEVENTIDKMAQGFFGYTSYEAIPFFESIKFKPQNKETEIPILRYRFYQYIIAFNHTNDEMRIIENKIEGLNSEISYLEDIINHKSIAVYPFESVEQETSNLEDAEYLEMVKQAQKHAFRGDTFQMVLSRRFQQKYRGDEFQVYRALRNINPSPYLFFFDYGDYKLMGSSPESQLIIKNKKAIIHPIAGTFKRTGNIQEDLASAEDLKADPKENAEHTMLVDLARNDLSKLGKNVSVSKLKEIQFFSSVIHMVSEVTAELSDNINPYEMIATTFPQGTLSGAPKYKAMELIDLYEPTSRGYYGGCIGFVGFDGTCNQAIMIRTFLAKNNHLYYQAGAGVVAKSSPESELQEVNNKLNALKKAIKKAETLNRA
ncbi:anthranilate synthase component I family protein [Riemerella anatipestifer]|uniref:anthranilate synthase component I family protein n=1 Tax=Riemerella anatipestifer TaxID=34085 RepID=UPI0021A48A56|nr:anthranilate synthase component I family protein [Riemerella anatipestifer]MCT6744727.1 anthranilate synthase component I family protein [Riemerella anatipestifer]MCU7572277.1 anthranilate synthase component I family protein [Riemerella anatipestifer]MCU7603359.1 anthranilate synthase component I family protein [Riemerella anatipestifer]MDY3369746.1 anthranilate synthase component I family protein [Riemerella anatipestifer]MDY3388202.1 anthranilate synthase component I family protein [Rieme